jgi:hypothetical protein
MVIVFEPKLYKPTSQSVYETKQLLRARGTLQELQEKKNTNACNICRE